jgi:hypothetical protein
MSIAIVPDTITISTDDPDVRLGVLRMLVRHAAGSVVTVRTLDQPDGTDLYVLDTQPGQLIDHLYGAAHFDNDTPLPDVPFPVIAYGRITGIHIY